MLVRFQCPERGSHDHVLVDLTVGASVPTALSKLSVPCPDCGRETRAEVFG